jgi:hypothetical protein
MKLLVLKTADQPLDLELLRSQIHDEITLNSLPTESEDGIAVFDAGTEPPWDWPDTVIRIGNIEVGRHHVDATLDPSSDIESTILDLYSPTTESDSNADMVNA